MQKLSKLLYPSKHRGLNDLLQKSNHHGDFLCPCFHMYFFRSYIIGSVLFKPIFFCPYNKLLKKITKLNCIFFLYSNIFKCSVDLFPHFLVNLGSSMGYFVTLGGRSLTEVFQVKKNTFDRKTSGIF